MPHRLLAHIEALKPVLAMAGAALSYVGGMIGSAKMPDMGWWFESGGMLALVGCLIYGLIALWKARGEERRIMLEQIHDERAEAKAEREDLIRRLEAKDQALSELNEEVRKNHRAQSEQLVDALNRLQRTMDSE